MDFKLGLWEGAYICANHVMDEKGMWPDDLCCTDLKTDTEKKTMADLEAIKPTKRTDEDKDKLNELRDIMPECEPMCAKISYPGSNEIYPFIKPCKYYQAPGSMARMVAGLAW